MSKRYQREIEEILRNMDQGESEEDGRVSQFKRPRARGSRGPQLSLGTLSIVLLVLSVLLMVAAAGIAFYEQTTSMLSGGVAVAAFIVFLLAAASGWGNYFRGSTLVVPPSSRYGASPFGEPPNTRRDAYTPPSSFGRITPDDDESQAPTPLRRGPLDTLRTRIRLFRLRQQYRRSHED